MKYITFPNYDSTKLSLDLKDPNFLNSKNKIKSTFASMLHNSVKNNTYKNTNDIANTIKTSNSPLCFLIENNLIVFDDDSVGSMQGIFYQKVKELNFPSIITKSISGKYHIFLELPNENLKLKFLNSFKNKRLKVNDNINAMAYDILHDNCVVYEGFGENKENACFLEKIEGKITENKLSQLIMEFQSLLGFLDSKHKSVFKKDGVTRVFTINQELINLVNNLIEFDGSIEDLFEIYKNKIANLIIPHYLCTNDSRNIRYLLLDDNFTPLSSSENNKEVSRNKILYCIKMHLIQSGVNDAKSIIRVLDIIQNILFETPLNPKDDSADFKGVLNEEVCKKEIDKYPIAYINKYISNNSNALLSDIYLNTDVKSNEYGRFVEIYYDNENRLKVKGFMDFTIVKKEIESNPLYQMKYMCFLEDKKDEEGNPIFVFPKKFSPLNLPTVSIIKDLNGPKIDTLPIVQRVNNKLYLNFRPLAFSETTRNYKNLIYPFEANVESLKNECPLIYKALVNTSSDKSLKRWSLPLVGFKNSLLKGDSLAFNIILTGIGGIGKTLLTEVIFKKFFRDSIKEDNITNLAELHDVSNDYVRKCLNLPVFKTKMSNIINQDWGYYLTSQYLLIEEVGTYNKSRGFQSFIEEYTEFMKPLTRSGDELIAQRKFKEDTTINSCLSLNIACINKLDFTLANEDNRRACVLSGDNIYDLSPKAIGNQKEVQDKVNEEFPKFAYFLLNTDLFDNLASDLDINNPSQWDSQNEMIEDDLENLNDSLSYINTLLTLIDKKDKESLSKLITTCTFNNPVGVVPKCIKFIALSYVVSNINEQFIKDAKFKKIISTYRNDIKSDKYHYNRASDFRVSEFTKLLYEDLININASKIDTDNIRENLRRIRKKHLLNAFSDIRKFKLDFVLDYQKGIE